MPLAARRDAFSDRQVEIETPEQVSVGYELADLGSRFVALLIDGALILCGWLALGVGVPYLMNRAGISLSALGGWSSGITLFAILFFPWCYFVFFEGLHGGRTPGKRAMRIRTVHDGGYPLTLRGAAVRNLLRLIDAQPFPSWLVGGVTMSLHPHTKRLGDLAAGTIVVRERRAADHPERRGATEPVAVQVLARSQREVWGEYRRLLERAQQKGVAALPEGEVARFAGLYRVVAADLARARTYGGSAAVLDALERWVGAGHNQLYRPRGRSWRRFAAWLAGGFPALVRRRWRPIALAAAALFLPALLAAAAVRAEPGRARALLPAEMIARAEESTARAAQGKGYIDVPEFFMPVLASRIIANNVQVTFFAFAGGILAGVGTVLVLVFNGVHLGAVAALFAHHGASLALWSFVLPHGIIELTAICIAGGAGLWLGSALLLPGRRTRREVLVERGREAVSLLGGTAVLLAVAGVIEGFISPSLIPLPVKVAVSASSAVLLAGYLLRAGGDGVEER
jgi:uncharacterized membrane protein SpoIIM required for sporulation/uncharacterized RDD family membrane protein YckC